MTATTISYPVPHIRQLKENLDEVGQLLEIHTKVAGAGRGRKYDVEVLNKSAIVLLVACWEAFVEDLAETGLRALLSSASDHSVLPDAVLERIASRNAGKAAWNLAGEGWKKAVHDNLREVLAKTTGALNTPRATQVDELFGKTVGIPNLSTCWCWPSRKAEHSRRALDQLISLRGTIAHRVKHSSSVRKREVTDAADLVGRLAERSSNKVRTFIHEQTGVYPWNKVFYGGGE